MTLLSKHYCGFSKDAQIAPPLSRQEGVDRREVHGSLLIENYRHIKRAYGGDIAAEVESQVLCAVQVCVGEEGVVGLEGDGVITVAVGHFALSGQTGSQVWSAWLEGLCDDVMQSGVRTTGGALHVWIGGTVSFEGQDTGSYPVSSLRFCGKAVEDSASWAVQYRADMERVAACLASFVSSTTTTRLLPNLAWQAVRAAGQGPVRTLYHEGLLRMVDRNGTAESPGDVIMAFERLGFARFLDRHVVVTAISELEASPKAVLGVNISAQSAALDGWWAALATWLQNFPDIAARLIIEIAETTGFPGITEAIRFTSCLKRTGCRIAIDDFGTGFASFRHVMALSPAIVKIDRVFLRRAARSDTDRTTLAHLAGLARATGGVVILEGVENASDVRIAQEVGIEWLQGYHYQRPTLRRPWQWGERASTERGCGPSQARRYAAPPWWLVGNDDGSQNTLSGHDQ